MRGEARQAPGFRRGQSRGERVGREGRDESFDAGARIDAVLKRPDIARDLPPLPTITPGNSARPWKSLADSIDDDAADD